MLTSAALLIQQPDGSTREVPLQAERVVLGRAPECDIVVEGRLISRQHAAISRQGTTYTLQDLDSHNGTAVNGRRVGGPWVLRAGDLIELGGVGRLTFVDGDATSTRPQAPAIGIWLDHAAQDVWIDGQRISPQLSPAQFNLIAALAERVDQVCSRAEIVAMVWPDVADGVSDEAIDALIKRVRARLGEAPGGQRYLTTLRGRGLMLHSPATAPPE
jgi:DNA-binding response OmpR family regulator